MSSSSSGLQSCAKILSRLSLEDSEANVEALATLLGTTKEALENELPSKTNTVSGALLKDSSDTEEDGGKQFLLCDLNLDQFGRSSYRSPWSNNYAPPCDEGNLPPPGLRQLETHANEVFVVYKDMYYGKDALSSVYVREAESGGGNANAATAFQARFLLRKLITKEDGYDSIAAGCWNSIHRFDVSAVDDEGNSTYKLASTVLVSMQPSGDDSKEEEALVCGSVSRSAEQSCKVRNGDAAPSHVSNMGTLLEEAEQEMRSNMHVIHIPKTRDVTDSIRRAGGSGADLVGAGGLPHGHGFALPGAGGGAGVLNQAMLGALKKKISESG